MASKKPTYQELQKRVRELEHQCATKFKSKSDQNSELDKYREIYNCFDEAVLVQDIETGKFLDVNTGFCSMYGISYEEAMREGPSVLLDCSPPYSMQDVVEWVRKTREEGPQTFEWLAKKYNGDRFWVEVNLRIANIGGQNCILAVVRDINETKRMEETVEKNQEQIRDILENLDATVFIHHKNTGKILFVSNQIYTMMGYTQDEALKLSIGDISAGIHPYTQKEAVEWVRKADTEGPQLFQWLCRRKDGSSFWAEVSLKKMSIAGEECILAITHDITEHINIKDALEKRITALTMPLEQEGAIEFEDLFNLEDIQRLQDEFAAATGVASLITRTDGTPITQPSNFSRMCGEFIPQSEKGRAKCYESDITLVKLSAHGPTVRNCLSCGFRRAGAGISVGGHHIANWLIGQVRDEEQTEEQIRNYARDLEVDEQEFIKAFYEVPTMDPARFDMIARMLFTLSNQLSDIAYQNLQQARFITLCQKAEASLKKEQQFIEKTLDSLPGLFYVLDNEGYLIRWNKTIEKVSGHNLSELPRMHFLDFFSKDEHKIVQERVRKVFETGDSFVEANLLTKTGDLIPHYFTGYRLLIEGRQCLVGMAIDITEQKMATDSLKKSEEQFRMLVQNTNIIIIKIDNAGKVLFINKFGEKFFGYSFDELAGKSIIGTILTKTDSSGKNLEQMLKNILDHPEDYAHNENENRLRNGEKVWIAWNNTPIRDKDNNLKEILCVGIDYTERKQMEEKLKYFQMAVDHATDAIGLATPEGRHFYQNKTLTDMLGGMSVEEIAGQEGGVPAGFANQKVAKEIFEELKAGGTWTGEVEMIDRHKKKFDVLLRASSIKDESGKVVGLVGIHSDITERKKSEKALRESEEKYRTIFNNALAGMFRTKIKDGLVLECNDQAARILGYENRDEIIGQLSVADIYADPDDRSRALAILNKSGELDKFDCRFLKKTGAPVWIRISARLYPDSGYLEGIIVDIDAEKNAENALRDSEEKYRTIFNSAQVGMFRTRIGDGKVLECNEQLARIFGYDSREECLDDLVASDKYVDPADRNRLIDTLKEHGEVDEFDTSYYRKDGEIIWVKITSRIYVDRDYIEGFIRDVTAQKLAEEENAKLEGQLLHAQKMESIGRLAGGVAHDFSNMLTPIIGYTELALMDMPENDKLYKPLNSIMKAAESASAITKQLLAFSRKQVLQLKIVNLNTVVARFSQMMQRLIGEDIALHMSLSPSLGKVRVDADQIDQILMNLAVNARDAMPDGGKLTIETSNIYLEDDYIESHPYARRGPHAMLAVTDNGCGMDAETQRHIFEPFYTTKGMTEGTGLGLSTVYGLAKQHGGHIQVYSEQGHGTTFKIYFPQADGLEDTRIDEPEQSLQKIKGGTETVLIVEDEEMIRKLASEIIELSGYNVLCACNGDEALQMARKSPIKIDLLLTDVIMPGMNGKELHQQIQKIYPGIRVIFTSGYTDNVITHHGVLDEGVNFLPKPFSGHSLLSKIRQTLDKPAS